MACNCSNCNTDPCGCQDHGLTTPCTYTNCATGNERCDDVQCTECVSYCGTSFQIRVSNTNSPHPDQGDVLKVVTGERVDQIIQKFALMIANGFGYNNGTAKSNSDNLNHAPYNVYAEAITSNSITVVWDGISNDTDYFDVVVDNAVVNTSGVTPVQNAKTKFVVSNLNPNTEYIIKVQAVEEGIPNVSLGNIQDSVELIVSTLAS